MDNNNWRPSLPPHNMVDQQRQLYQSQRTLPEMPSSSLDSTAQTESANGGDWQEEVFQKIKSMKETYLPNLTEMYQRVGAKLQQLESLPQQQRSEQFEKLKQYKTMLERMMQFLSVSKSNIMPPLKDKVAFYEKQIVTFLKMHGPRTGVQQGQLPQSQMQPMQQTQSQTVQDQSHDNQTNPQIQSMNMQGTGPRAQQSSLPNNNVLSSRPGVSASQQNIPSPIPASSSLDSTAQTESANGGDWQEEVFQKIKSMKETYLPNLTEMYQRVGAKLQQLESLPQQQRSEQFEKLKQYKTMLERMMQFLSVSKSNIMPPLKDKVPFYEKQIVTFLKMHGPRTGVQQGQLPQSQMQPMQQTQSQTVQDQSHDNQTNPAANNGTSLDSSNYYSQAVLIKVETLKKHIPFSGPDGINELTRIATRFEERIFGSAIDRKDYRQKISMKMLTMKTKLQNAAGSSSSIPAADDSTSMYSCISQLQRVTLGE